jgi:hypothetical protein
MPRLALARSVIGGGWQAACDHLFFFIKFLPGSQTAFAAAQTFFCKIIAHHVPLKTILAARGLRIKAKAR